MRLEEERLAGAEEALRDSPYSTNLAHRHHAYLARGRYAEQLARLEPLVGRERLLVLDSGRFFTEPELVYDRVLAFLGLPHLGDPVFDRHNARTSPRRCPAGSAASCRPTSRSQDTLLTSWLGGEPSWRR